MAGYQFTLDQLRVRSGDMPAISGLITGPSGSPAGSGDLALATVGYVRSPINAPSEAAVVLTADGFSYQYTAPVRDPGMGNVYLRVFPKVVGLTAVLNGGINDSVGTATFTVSAGALPERGWVVIDSEICAFVRTSATTGDITRAQFGPAAAAHLSGAACTFAAGSVTCETAARLEVYEEKITP